MGFGIALPRILKNVVEPEVGVQQDSTIQPVTNFFSPSQQEYKSVLNSIAKSANNTTSEGRNVINQDSSIQTASTNIGLTQWFSIIKGDIGKLKEETNQTCPKNKIKNAACEFRKFNSLSGSTDRLTHDLLTFYKKYVLKNPERTALILKIMIVISLLPLCFFLLIILLALIYTAIRSREIKKAVDEISKIVDLQKS